MKNIKLKFPKSLSTQLVTVFLIIGVLVVVGFETSALIQAYTKIRQAMNDSPEIKNAPVVRVNFTDYEKIVSKLTQTSVWEKEAVPETPEEINPFQPLDKEEDLPNEQQTGGISGNGNN